MLRFIFGVILLAFLAAVGIFAVQNTQVIKVQFLNLALTAPVALMAVAVYFLGMLSGWTVVGFLRSSINRVTADPRSD
ncbi:MAG: LapA family protein [Planctomycetia bacterium]|nr:LapA family protein [Planctomycetia bacterium]